MITVAVFYLIGVFGVGVGHVSLNWSSQMTASDQVLDAVEAGISWPIATLELARDL